MDGIEGGGIQAGLRAKMEAYRVTIDTCHQTVAAGSGDYHFGVKILPSFRDFSTIKPRRVSGITME